MNIKRWAKGEGAGFTIIELVVVIVVIGILSAVVIVAYNGVKNRSNDTTVQTDLKSIGTSLKAYKALTGTYPTTSAQLSAMTDSNGSVVTAALPKVSHGGYDVMTPSSGSDPVVRNLLICIRSGADPEFGIAALSKSGNIWFFTSNGGLTQSGNAWSGVYGTECPLVSIQTSDPGFAYWFAYQRNPSTTTDTEAGWQGWSVN